MAQQNVPNEGELEQLLEKLYQILASLQDKTERGGIRRSSPLQKATGSQRLNANVESSDLAIFIYRDGSYYRLDFDSPNGKTDFQGEDGV